MITIKAQYILKQMKQKQKTESKFVANNGAHMFTHFDSFTHISTVKINEA